MKLHDFQGTKEQKSLGITQPVCSTGVWVVSHNGWYCICEIQVLKNGF